jgi:hypothetical protein
LLLHGIFDEIRLQVLFSDDDPNLVIRKEPILFCALASVACPFELAVLRHAVLVQNYEATSVVGDAQVYLSGIQTSEPECLDVLVDVTNVGVEPDLGTIPGEVLVPRAVKIIGDKAVRLISMCNFGPCWELT